MADIVTFTVVFPDPIIASFSVGTAKASDVALLDAGGHYAATTVEGALAEIAVGAGVAGVASVNARTGVVVLTSADVGLSLADNTADASKPVSIAQQTALDLKAPLANPTLTGTPAAPTAIAGTNTTQISTTEFVTSAIAAIPAGLSVANPTGTIGLTAVNGSASSAIRSDSAPALSQAIVPTWTGVHTFTPTIAANTSADGILLKNTGTASSGNQFYSPRLHFQGQGWKTNSTAASQVVDAILELQPVQGTASPNWALIGRGSINGGAYSNFFKVDSDGLVEIGGGMTVGGYYNVQLGFGSNNSGHDAVIIGKSAVNVSGDNSVVVGANATGSFAGVVVLGGNSAATAVSQFVAGSSTATMTNVFFGKGVTNSSATDYTLNGTGGSGSNNAGGSLKLAAGKSTGSATPASVQIQTTVLQSSGSTAQTLATTATFTTDGLQMPNNLTRVSTQFDSTSATLANITGLTSTVVAAGTYMFRAVLDATLDATGSGKYAIGGTATATAINYRVSTLSASSLPTVSARQTALASAVTAIATVTSDNVIIEGTIVVNAAGTLTVQFAEASATGTGSILVGSTFQVTKI